MKYKKGKWAPTPKELEKMLDYEKAVDAKEFIIIWKVLGSILLIEVYVLIIIGLVLL